MASNTDGNDQFHQANAAPGLQGYPQYHPGYGAAMMNPFGQWPAYSYPFMPQYHMPPMPNIPGMAPGFFTPPTVPHMFPEQYVSCHSINEYFLIKEIYIGPRHLGLLESGRL